MTEPKDIHYYVGCPEQSDEMLCVYAPSQEAAVTAYVNGDNPYGYGPDDFDGVEVLIVPASKVSVWSTTVKTVEVSKVR